MGSPGLPSHDHPTRSQKSGPSWTRPKSCSIFIQRWDLTFNHPHSMTHWHRPALVAVDPLFQKLGASHVSFFSNSFVHRGTAGQASSGTRRSAWGTFPTFPCFEFSTPSSGLGPRLKGVPY